MTLKSKLSIKIIRALKNGPLDTTQLAVVIYGKDYSREQSKTLSCRLNNLRKYDHIVKISSRLSARRLDSTTWVLVWGLP